MTTRNIVPRTTEEGQIGTAAKKWSKGYFKEVFMGGTPAKCSVEGHAHAQADVTNLVTALAGKASTAVATTSAAGLVELATDAETKSGTDTTRSVTPAGLKSIRAKTLVSQSFASLGSHLSVLSLADIGSGVVLAGTGTSSGHIYKSTDSGDTWTDKGQLGGESMIFSLVSLGSGVVLAGTHTRGKIYKSANSGDTWTEIGQLGTKTFVTGLASLGSGVVLAVAQKPAGVFKSTDSGDSWTEITGVLGSDTDTNAILSLGSGVVIASGGYTIAKSTNSGDTWTTVHTYSNPTGQFFCLASLGSGVVMAGTYGGGRIFKSVNSGDTWTEVGQIGSTARVFELIPLGSGVVVACCDDKVYRSTDSGDTWTEVGAFGAETEMRRGVKLDSGIVLAGTTGHAKIYQLREATVSW